VENNCITASFQYERRRLGPIKLVYIVTPHHYIEMPVLSPGRTIKKSSKI
jgi:hypothetical protein